MEAFYRLYRNVSDWGYVLTAGKSDWFLKLHLKDGVSALFIACDQIRFSDPDITNILALTGCYGSNVGVSNSICCWCSFPTQKHDQWSQSPNNQSVKSRSRLCNSARLHTQTAVSIVFFCSAAWMRLLSSLWMWRHRCVRHCKCHKRHFKFNMSDCRNVFWIALQTTFKCDLDPTYKNHISKNDFGLAVWKIPLIPFISWTGDCKNYCRWGVAVYLDYVYTHRTYRTLYPQEGTWSFPVKSNLIVHIV